MSEGAADALPLLREALAMREKWTGCEVGGRVSAVGQLPPAAAAGSDSADLRYVMVDGIMRDAGESPRDADLFAGRSVADFVVATDRLSAIRSTGPVVSYSYQRLQLLEAQYTMHCMLNGEAETQEMMAIPHRDFYNVRKVDTHVHHSASMNAKHLLRFIKKKCKYHSEETVIMETSDDGTERPVRLRDAFERIDIDPYDLSLDKLAVMADKGTFHRFDKFNLKYNPCGDSLLRTIFLKTDNHLGGRYLAELTRELFADLEETKYQLSEYRLSIYGRKSNEWNKLASWVMSHGLISAENKWMIQIPRIFNVYASLGMLENFGQMLDNIFRPLFEVSCNPECDPVLHQFLGHVSGLDSVDDESKVGLDKPDVLPADWTMQDNPSYRYYSYYIWANLRALNHLRASRGLNTFAFRPHAGEAGPVDNLDNTFLLADSINHGINLKLSPALQYLYYLAQIGLAMSPLSNNLLFVDYAKNPFFPLFARGLNVSLSTDDPLMFHQTKEPLMEEYSIAKQVWRLSSADLCELARMSVLQSGFDRKCKERWIGSADPVVNDIAKTNVPHIRMRFRQRLLNEETKLLSSDGATDSISPTELGQYNARMLLSPSSGRARNAEVMRLERMNTFSLCECHPNGRTSSPPLNASSANAESAVAAASPSDGSEGDGRDNVILTCAEAATQRTVSLQQNELEQQQIGTRQDDKYTGCSADRNVMRDVADKLARLQVQLEELKAVQDRSMLATAQPQVQPSIRRVALDSVLAQVRRWWVAMGVRGKAIPLIAVVLWICRRAFRPARALVAAVGKS